MSSPDHWTETLRRKEKADEDRYFAEQDRKLIEKRHRQRQLSQPIEIESHATAADIPVAPAPLDSAEP